MSCRVFYILSVSLQNPSCYAKYFSALIQLNGGNSVCEVAMNFKLARLHLKIKMLNTGYGRQVFVPRAHGALISIYMGLYIPGH